MQLACAGKVLIHEGTNYPRFKLLLELTTLVRKIQVLRDALGIVHIVQRAAAVLRRSIPCNSGKRR